MPNLVQSCEVSGWTFPQELREPMTASTETTFVGMLMRYGGGVISGR